MFSNSSSQDSLDKLSSTTLKPQCPVICIDMDGVIWRQNKPLPGSREAVHLLTSDLREIDECRFGSLSVNAKQPYLFITNSGACLEQDRADRVNSLFQLPEQQQVNKENVILNFTPLREQMLQYKDRVVLIAGQEDYEKVAMDCGMNKYVTFDEYAHLFPDLVPFAESSPDQRILTQQRVMARHGVIDPDYFHQPLQVHAIFFLFECKNIENIIQITCDLLTTENGSIANQLPIQGPSQHIPVYSVVNDYFFPSKFTMNRMGFGLFVEALKEVYRKTLHTDLDIIKCGKPTTMTFQYAEKQGTLLADNAGVDVSGFYMVGDNPASDIRGAKAMGWHTILVQTGVYKSHHQLSEQDKPDVIVPDFKAAVQYIYDREGIQCQLN